MKNLWRAIQFIPEYRGRVLGVILVGTTLGFVATATPYLYKMFVDTVARMLSGTITHAQASTIIITLVGVFFVLRLAVVVFGAIQNRQADDLWLHAVSTFRQRVFENMTRKSIDYFERTRVGEIMDRFGNITTITMWLSTMTEATLAAVLQMVFILGVLLVKAPLIGVIMTVVVAFNIWLSYRTAAKALPFRRGWQTQAGRMSGLLAEMVSNISTVRSFGGEATLQRQYDETQAKWKDQRAGLHDVEWRSEQALNIANTFGVFFAVSLAAHGALKGMYTPGDILLMLTLSQNLTNIIGPITRQINQAGDIESTAERLVELLDVEAEQADAPDAVPLTHFDELEFKSVGFRYPGTQDYALKDISFHLRSGETLALVGSSGSGKTTLIKLLMRFYDPSEGRILINGRDLRDYQQRSVRAMMGVVLQDVSLFNDSIGENIAFARPGAGIEDVRAAARAANADAFILGLSMQYDTLVGERGIKLSGGEKQRVAIARAILKNPQLIILDEATSALDSESEQQVQQGLNQLMTGRTSVVIAHRLSTVINAHLILVLRHGKVVESGNHETLSQDDSGFYAYLYALQSGRQHSA